MRVKGLDTLRFILAMVVVVGHIGIDFAELSSNSTLKPLLAILNNSFVGVAAVIVFFIISGFCIHFPYANGKKINFFEFEIKRFLRIAIPAFFGIIIYYYYNSSLLGVVWSLVCELIYYIMYPFILFFINRQNNRMLIHVIVLVFLTILSFLTSIFYDYSSTSYNGDFHRSGFNLTWIVGFPVWYLGVILADQYVKGIEMKFIKINHIYFYRVMVWGLAMICSIARFHLNISYAYTLIIFAIPTYFWLYAELKYFNDKVENRLMAFGGIMSYSIYIIHMTAFSFLISIYNYYEIGLKKENLSFVFLLICITLILSVIFYFLVEKPSHKIAQRVRLR